MNERISNIFDYGDEIVVVEERDDRIDPARIKELTMDKINHAHSMDTASGKKARRIRRAVLIAACAGLIVLAGIFTIQYEKLLKNTTDNTAAMESELFPTPTATAETPVPEALPSDEPIAPPEEEAAVTADPPLTVITGYGDITIDASYMIPENGEIGYSEPLKGAMWEYGSDVSYKVVVDLFSDEQPIAADSIEAQKEIERLAEAGYDAGLEVNGESFCFTLTARCDQLQEFDADSEYGYMLFLYDERVSTTESQTIAEETDRGVIEWQEETRSYEELAPAIDGSRDDSGKDADAESETDDTEYVVVVCTGPADPNMGESDYEDPDANGEDTEGCYLDPNDPNPDYDVDAPGYE